MNKILPGMMIALLVLGLFPGAAVKADDYYDSKDRDAVLAGYALVLGGLSWLVVKGVKKSRRTKAEKKVQSSQIEQKKKLHFDVVLDVKPETPLSHYTLSDAKGGPTYRVGMALRF